MGLGDRLQHAWNAFMNNRDPTVRNFMDSGGYTYRPDRPRLSRGNERSIVTSVINRIALDVAAIEIRHCKLDDDGRYTETIDSRFNKCLNLEANIDQSGRAFIQDAVMSMFDEGCVALVPVDTDIDPTVSGAFDICSMRTAKILEWYPQHVKVKIYNDRTGQKQDIKLPKKSVAIIENPLFAVMNEPNSTLQRLIRKLNLLDAIDEQSGSGKLDLIIQLPYAVNNEIQRDRADVRRKDIEQQLTGSKYGIAYAGATEKITQLNRSVDNNLMTQIEYLTSMLYSQLGITTGVLDGTADEKTMLNYHTRAIEPIIAAIVDEMKRKFLTKTAITQKQSIMYFRDPFKLIPASEMAEVANTYARNGILDANEVRQIIGRKPSNDPNANKLINSNIKQPDTVQQGLNTSPEENTEEGEGQNGES